MAKMFSMMHQSVNDYSKRMLVEMRRHNYVTPTNYLELVNGYKQLRNYMNYYLRTRCVDSVTL